MSASKASGVWELIALPNRACHPVTPSDVALHNPGHSQRLDGYRGDFETFIKSKQERLLNQQREYEAQQQYRQHIQVGEQAGLGTRPIPWVLESWGVRELNMPELVHLQVFIDRFRYNANRASQVQSKLKMLEKL